MVLQFLTVFSLHFLTSVVKGSFRRGSSGADRSGKQKIPTRVQFSARPEAERWRESLSYTKAINLLFAALSASCEHSEADRGWKRRNSLSG